MVTSHHPRLNDKRLSSRSEECSSFEPCEVLTEEEWMRGGLTPWVDSVDKGDVSLVHVDGTQDKEVILEASRLEEPLHFKTTSTGIGANQDVKDYPKVPPDWYRYKDEQTHITEGDWNYVDVPIRVGHWMLEWSSCDPQQCWVEIWKLWVEDGIRIQLGAPTMLHRNIRR
jgi:hypothetical protein